MHKHVMVSAVTACILAFWCSVAEPAQGQFRYPLDNWTPTGNCWFGSDACGSPGKFHLGVDGTDSDVSGVVGTPVYAPCDGLVKEAESHSGYGGTVIIECDVGPETVTVLVAHMYESSLQVEADNPVQIGDPIGFLADSSNNGGWDPHCHFGIRKGSYDPGCAPCPGTSCGEVWEWNYGGYTSCVEILEDWHDPDAFVPDHQYGIGQGSVNPAAFLDAYNRMSGVANGWVPQGPVEDLVTGELQRFITDNVGEAIITLVDGSPTAYGTYGAIYQKYKLLGETASDLGFPISDEGDTYPSPYGSTGRYTRLENGTINFINGSGDVHEVHGPNFDYFEAHGYSGWHGFPTSDVEVWNGGERTDVEEGGYIFTDSGGRTCYVSPTAPCALEAGRITLEDVLLWWLDRSSIETNYCLIKEYMNPSSGKVETERIMLAAGASDTTLPANTTSYLDESVIPGNVYSYSVEGYYSDAPSPRTNEVIVNLSSGHYPFVDDMEDPGSGNWLADVPWGIITNDYHSETRSWTDSPGGYYENSADVSLATSFSADLSSATQPILRFWHHYDLEPGYDFGFVEVSTNGGIDWTQLAQYSGTESQPAALNLRGSPKEHALGEQRREMALLSGPYMMWTMDQIDLTAYSGTPALQIRYRLDSDESVPRDGWYIDDVALAELPSAMTLQPVANPTSSSLELLWTESADSNFSRYEIYRSEADPASFNDDLVAAISNPAITSYMDDGLAPKTTFFYRVYVVNGYGIYSGSNQESGTTLAGLDYPFMDDMEGGPKWYASVPNTWRLISPGDAHSGNKIWTDSPGSDYGNSWDTAMELAGTLPLTDASATVFWHRIDIASGDTAFAEISTDNGATWQSRQNFTNTTVSEWTRVQLDVSDVQMDAAIRFRMKTDASGTAEGWDIDDVSVSDAPAAVTLDDPVLSPGYGSLEPDWTETSSLFFKEYRVYRSVTPTVNTFSTLVFTTPYPLITSYTDSTVDPGVTYCYRVYEISTYDVYIASNLASGVPTGAGYPFFDDMESTDGDWVADSPWARTTENAHGGSWSWTDSRGTPYNADVDASLKISLSLLNAVQPYLSFWEWHWLGASSHAYVEYSTNGISWYQLADFTGYSPGWRERRIDLSQYRFETNFWVRFRLYGGGTQGEGWYIDDVTIAEDATADVTYPFYDGMEDSVASVAQWMAGSWEVTSPGYLGDGAWVGSVDGYYSSLTIHSSLSFAGAIDLTGAVAPQLVFWHHKENWGASSYAPIAYVQIQPVGGTWTHLWSSSDPPSTWGRQQIDLSSYAGSKARIRFRLYGTGGSNSDYGTWYVDEITVAEPGAVAEINATPAEMYFSVHPDSSRTDTLTIANTGTNTLNFSIEEGTGGSPALLAKGGQLIQPLADLPWLSVSPVLGSVPIGGSQDVLVTCSGSGGAGSYTGYLVISSNDPVNNPTVVPINLNVSDVYLLGPSHGDSLETDNAYSIAWNVSFTGDIDSVDLALSVNGGITFNHVIVSGYTGPSPYAWTVPYSPSDSCVVKLIAYVSGSDSLIDDSDGLFTIYDPLSGVDDVPEDVPAVTTLLRNRPNPFSSSTVIRYVSGDSDRISLRIYDARGRLVRTLVDEICGTNYCTSSVTWDGTDDLGKPVPAGVYFCRLSTVTCARSNKLVIMR